MVSVTKYYLQAAIREDEMDMKKRNAYSITGRGLDEDTSWETDLQVGICYEHQDWSNTLFCFGLHFSATEWSPVAAFYENEKEP